MPSVLIQTADAVVAALNQPTTPWALPFTAERSYAEWDLPLEEQQCERGKLYCDVVPRGDMGFDSETQGSVVLKPEISIVLRKKFQPRDSDVATGRLTKAAVDELVALTEEIANAFALARPGSYEYAAWQPATRNLVLYVPRHLRELNQFTAVIPLTYQASLSA